MNTLEWALRFPSKFGRVPSRGNLSPKRMPPGFYKGRGVRPIGRHTKKGGYIIDPKKLPAFEVPDLTNCDLKPYVSTNTTIPEDVETTILKPNPKKWKKYDADEVAKKLEALTLYYNSKSASNSATSTNFSSEKTS